MTVHAREISDDELMRRLEAGDHEATLADLDARHRGWVYRLVRRIVGDEHLAQDVTQEVIERIFLKSHLYQPGTSFRAWLAEVARNQARSALRAGRAQPLPVSNVGREDDELLGRMWAQPDPRLAEERELMAALQQAIARLPEHYWLVFDLCVTRGMEYQEAARHLNLPLGTVAVRLRRARQRLFAAVAPLLGRLRRPPACAQA